MIQATILDGIWSSQDSLAPWYIDAIRSAVLIWCFALGGGLVRLYVSRPGVPPFPLVSVGFFLLFTIFVISGNLGGVWNPWETSTASLALLFGTMGIIPEITIKESLTMSSAESSAATPPKPPRWMANILIKIGEYPATTGYVAVMATVAVILLAVHFVVK